MKFPLHLWTKLKLPHTKLRSKFFSVLFCTRNAYLSTTYLKEKCEIMLSGSHISVRFLTGVVLPFSARCVEEFCSFNYISVIFVKLTYAVIMVNLYRDRYIDNYVILKTWMPMKFRNNIVTYIIGKLLEFLNMLHAGYLLISLAL